MSEEFPSKADRNPAAHVRLVLWRANKAVEKLEQAHLQSLGLGLSGFGILEVLLHKGPLPVNVIGEKVLLTSGSMTPAVQRLEDKGWVVREKSAADRRMVCVALTESGRELIEDLYAKHLRCLEEVVSVLTDEEQAQLIGLLKKVGHRAGVIL